MRFIGYGPAILRGCKIDWDASVVVDDALRRALHPNDPGVLRAGRLRRPFRVKLGEPGRRSRRIARREPVTHASGAIVFAYADDAWFLIEAPVED
jgi:hypothetical protein